ncbi:DNA polymerase delta, subunit 4 [Exophiala viscosa]|uniref:DNA polymerase delta, subunit 4 n=1 Tax=Exophiala viscosa TaxID=2486360 RepID=UPI00219C6142|nr:DNA polymerase delta, subunit 4 [Exophiala viscosa]
MARGRKAKGATTSSAQSTLTFNNSTRVTKPGARHDDSKESSRLSNSAQSHQEEEVKDIETPEVDEEPATIEVPEPEAESTQVEIAAPGTPAKLASSQKPKSKKKATEKDDRKLAAEKVTDAQIKKYWRAEEDSRLAPRIHQESLSIHEKILRHFDLSSQYGPCIGISRLLRWKRANMLGLEPPVEVLAVLLREEDKKTSQGCGKLAYIDELAGGRVVLVE